MFTTHCKKFYNLLRRKTYQHEKCTNQRGPFTVSSITLKQYRDRLNVNRKGRGKYLLQTEVTYKAEIINIAEYLNIKYTRPVCKYC
jgi:hypothetical protein